MPIHSTLFDDFDNNNNHNNETTPRLISGALLCGQPSGWGGWLAGVVEGLPWKYSTVNNNNPIMSVAWLKHVNKQKMFSLSSIRGSRSNHESTATHPLNAGLVRNISGNHTLVCYIT